MQSIYCTTYWKPNENSPKIVSVLLRVEIEKFAIIEFKFIYKVAVWVL